MMNSISTVIFAVLISCAASGPTTPKFQQYSQVPYQGQPTPFAPQPSPYKAQPFVPAPAPQAHYKPSAKQGSAEADKDAQVVSQYQDVNYDGTFNYGFDSNNGISVKSEGFVKDAGSPEPKQVIQGNYFYYDKEGLPVNVVYIADEYGFRAESDAIPKASPEILKSLEFNAAHPESE